MRVEEAVARSADNDSSAAVMFIDLDDFKMINDRYGHVVGDAYLTSAGRRLRAAAGSSAVVARIATRFSG